MFIRDLITIVQKDLQAMPVVALLGPRQIGKTTLVKQLAEADPEKFLYLDLESPADMVKLKDPESFLSAYENKTVIIDEVQRLPDLFPVLRSVVDKKRVPGRFLLLGSASPNLLEQSSESLAGRIRYRELFPFTLLETGADNLHTLWLRGGFPEAYLASDDDAAMDWLTDFLQSYASRDMRELGLAMPAAQIIRLLQMLAHMHGQIINYSNLSKSLGVSQPTISTAVYYLEEAMLIRTLKPWFFNSKKRLVKSPKVYIRDSGMLHNLLFLNGYNQLMGHPQAGNSWEGFVIQQILAALPRTIKPWFYRSQDGAEIDLLLSKGNTLTAAIEIKLSNAPEITRGNTQSFLDLKPDKAVIITPNADNFMLKQWEVMNIEMFLKRIQEFIG